jgi:tetratricopeptide (TPR) repeat protein/predicted aspartyl protease
VVAQNGRNPQVNLKEKGVKRFMKLTWICLLTIVFSLSLFAKDDVQNQIEDERQVLKQGEKLSRKGELEPAEELLRRYLLSNPNSIKAKLLLSYVLLKKRNFVESYKISFEIAKNDNKNARAYALVGNALLNEGRFNEAEPILVSAILLNKKEALAWSGLGMLEFYENKIQDGLSKLRRAVYLDGNEPDFLYIFAQVAARNENYKDAAEGYRRFLSIAPFKDKDRRSRIKGLIEFLEFLGTRQALYDLSGKDQTTLPVEMINQRPIIRVKLGKSNREFRFVLDTGSGITVLSEETAKSMNIDSVARGGSARAIGGDGKFEIVYGFLKTLGIGDAKVNNVPIYIRKFHDDSNKVDGFLGLAVISRFLTTLDYGNRTFTLVKREKENAEVLEKSEFLLPLRLTSSGFLSGEVKLEGVDFPLNFIVDTGASVSVISSQLANSSELNRFMTDDKLKVIGAAGVLENVSQFVLPKVTFGSHSQSSLTAIALNLETINETSGFLQSGILGGNFLQNYRLTFDFKNSKIAFVPNNK